MGERKFLHDIATPLTGLQLNLENALAILSEESSEDAATCARVLKTCLVQAKRMGEMLRERREFLIQKGVTE